MAASQVLKASRLGTVTVMAGLPFLSYKVYAAEAKPCTCSSLTKVSVCELPIYGNPEDKFKYKYIPEQESMFRRSVSSARESVWEYLDSMQDTTDKIQKNYYKYSTLLKGYVKFLQEDPSVLPKAAVITVSGLGGIVAGYRGGVFRKLFFCASAMTAATALCYPKEAVKISSAALDSAFAQAMKTWDNLYPKKEPPKKPECPKPNKINPNLMDFGQSNPADKDMYTTRGR